MSTGNENVAGPIARRVAGILNLGNFAEKPFVNPRLEV